MAEYRHDNRKTEEKRDRADGEADGNDEGPRLPSHQDWPKLRRAR